MKRIFYLTLISLFLFALLPNFSAITEASNFEVIGYPTPTIKLEVGEKIPAPTEELKVGEKVEPSPIEIKVIKKIPAPSPSLTIYPVKEYPTLNLTPTNSVPITISPMVTGPIPITQYPIVTGPISIEPWPILTDPTPIQLPPALERARYYKSIEELIAAAKADLSQRLRIKIGEISVQSITEKNWPDASLGCPQEAMLYAQVITPGYLIILEAGGEIYDYRASLNWVRFCSVLDQDNPQTEVRVNSDEVALITERQTPPSVNNFSPIIKRLKTVLARLLPFNL